jgi:hypothetical protein
MIRYLWLESKPLVHRFEFSNLAVRRDSNVFRQKIEDERERKREALISKTRFVTSVLCHCVCMKLLVSPTCPSFRSICYCFCRVCVDPVDRVQYTYGTIQPLELEQVAHLI